MARREQRKGDRLLARAEGSGLLIAPPPGHLVPWPLLGRSGMQALRERLRPLHWLPSFFTQPKARHQGKGRGQQVKHTCLGLSNV